MFSISLWKDRTHDVLLDKASLPCTVPRDLKILGASLGMFLHHALWQLLLVYELSVCLKVRMSYA
jgi:hypothetical protein